MHLRSNAKSVLVLSTVLASAMFAGGCSGRMTASAGVKAPEVEPAAPVTPPLEPESPKVVATGDVSLSGNKVNLPGEIEFATGSAKIADTARNKEILAELLQFTKENSHVTRLRIEGHTDNVGKRTKNMKLSSARAASIVAFLAKQGVDTKRLHAVGFGADKPASDNDTEDGRQRNRRTEFHVEEIDNQDADAVAAKEPPPAPPVAVAVKELTPAPTTAPPAAKGAPPAVAKIAPPAAVAAEPASPGVPTPIDWTKTLLAGAKHRVGITATFTCPPAPPYALKPNGMNHVHGGADDDYLGTSFLCDAAVHAGKITPAAGGTFTLVVHNVAKAYKGTTANGVAGQDKSPFGDRGFGFNLAATPTATPSWDDKFLNMILVGTIGDTKTYVCPAAGSARMADVIGGPDGYNDWSGVCAAAVHAGKITPEKGGKVTFVIKQGVPYNTPGDFLFKSSTANGVTSKEKKEQSRYVFTFK